MNNPAPGTDPLTKLFDEKLEQIVRERLGIPTLTSRGSDKLDFHEVHVDALSEAFVDIAIFATRIGWKEAENKFKGQLGELESVIKGIVEGQGG